MTVFLKYEMFLLF